MLPDALVGPAINSPLELQMELDRLCRALDAAGRELGQRIEELADAEIAYGDAFEDSLVQLVEDHASTGDRLPGEDVRRALIHKTAGVRERYHVMRRLQRRVEAVEKWSRKVESELNGRQSQLRSMLEESRHGS